MERSRNYSIDSLKFYCALAVVLIHSQFLFKDVVLPLLRVAVPIFFMISGYFIYGEKAEQRIKKAITKISLILAWSTLLFAFLKEIFLIVHHNVYVPNAQDLVNFFVFNENPFGWHLWYIGAYLYVLIIVWVIARYDKWMLLFKSVPILLIILLFLSYISVERIYYRNFLFMGLPFFAIGAYVRKKNRLVNRKILYVLISLLFMSSLAENYVTNQNLEIYLSTIFLSVLIFSFFIGREQPNSSLSSMGGQYSLYIYIFHGVFVLYFFPTLNGHCGNLWNRIYNSFSPIFIICATSLFIVLYKKGISSFKFISNAK